MKLFRRKKRHVHTWTNWKLVTMHGVHLKSGVRFESDAQTRSCTECGYMQREDL